MLENRNIRGVIVGLLVLVGSFQAQAQSVTRINDGYIVKVETTITVDRSMTELNISSYPGDVEIERTTSTQAIFFESIYVDANNEREAREYALGRASKIDDTNRTLRLRDIREPERAHSLRIVLPVFMEVNVSVSYGDIDLSGGEARSRLTTGAGDIQVENLLSSLEIRTGAGDIEAENISGPLTARSGAGDVELSNVGSDVAVITGAGDIYVMDVAGRVSATTGGGQIDVRRLKGNLTLLTAGGDIDLKYVEGNIELNTSGGSIELDNIIGGVRATTAGGDIEVRKLAGSLTAETLAGDIEVFDIAGDVKIVTKVGDVFVRVDVDGYLTTRRIHLRAENGDVDVQLPPKIDADIRVDLGFIGSLDTDQFSGALVWSETRRASPDNRIRRARGRINNGGTDIDLSSGAGDITISDSHD